GANIPIWEEPWPSNGMNIYVPAKAITKTPLFDQVTEDRLIWKAEKNGQYLVKSTYRLCVEELIDTNHLRISSFWAGVWRLKVPPKVKNLIWRSCRGCFPTRVRHRDKGIDCPSNCVVCNDNFEDTSHVFCLCPFAASIWRDSGLWNHVEAAVNSSNTVAETIFMLLQNLEEQNSARLAVIMWSIWKHRNMKLWNRVTETKEQVLNRADHLLEDWRAAKNTTTQQMSNLLLS
ncbi:pentatricopeptide repeat-containing protein, partial [Trifolium pratense]